MSDELTHWRKLVNPNYIGAYSMPTDGTDIILTIKNVVKEIVKGEGGKTEECTVAYFMEDSKPMILNRTNCKIIHQIHKTPYIENWAGKKIQIYVAQVKVANETVEGLRIRPHVPKTELPTLNKATPQYAKVLEYMKSDKADIKNVENKYQLTEEIRKELLNAKQ